MFEKFVQNYYELLDERIENGTLVVLLISFLVMTVWIVIPENHSAYAAANILQSSEITSYVVIDGERYELVKYK